MPSHDAIVIGAGLIGSAIALRLAQDGLHVALLEKNAPGREASWAGAGMLSPAPDSSASIPLVPFGRASLSLYPQFVAEIEEISGRRTGYRKRRRDRIAFFRRCRTRTEHAHCVASRSGTAERAPSARRSLRGGARLDAPRTCGGLPCRTKLRSTIERSWRLFSPRPARTGVEILADTQAREVDDRGRALQRRAHQKWRRFRSARGHRRGRRLFRPAGGNRSQAWPRARFADRWPRSNSAKAPIRHVVRCEHGYIVPRDSAAPQRAGDRQHARGRRLRQARHRGRPRKDSFDGAGTGA